MEIDQRCRDDRYARMLADPKAYFAERPIVSREAVRAEMERDARVVARARRDRRKVARRRLVRWFR